MPRFIKLLVGLSAALVALLVLAVWIMTSSWTVWGLLDREAEYRIVIRPKALPASLQQPLYEYLNTAYPAVGPFIKHVQYVAIQRKGQDVTVAILPTIIGQFTVPQGMEKSGWQVQRVGPYVVALPPSQRNSQIPAKLSRLPQAAWLALSSRPLRPDLVSAIPGPALGFSGSIYMAAVGQGNRLDMSFSQSAFASLPSESSQGQNFSGRLLVSIPSQYLGILPGNLMESWNQLIASKVNFIHTAPDFLADVSGSSRIEISDTPTGFSLAYDGALSDVFLRNAEVWAQDEERYSRPERRGFNTPDGTLGYEIVPGEPGPVMHGWLDSCRAPLEGKTGMWLCRQGGRAVIGNSEGATRAGLEPLAGPDQWLVVLPEPVLKNFRQGPVCDPSARQTVGIKAVCQASSVRLEGAPGSVQASVTF